MNVLILDDEKEIADLVEVYLQNENYNVYKFYTQRDWTIFNKKSSKLYLC